MRIIQTFWSAPGTGTGLEKRAENRLSGGWVNERFHAMSWALSCLTWKRFYPHITLYTDTKGADWLINDLGLPYDDVQLKLDELDGYNPMLWALPKVFVYRQQQEPFIHADGDVYIWERLPERLVKSELFCQNIEIEVSYYRTILAQIQAHFSYVPSLLHIGPDEPFTAINAGILGGSDLAFFHELADRAFRFIDENRPYLDKVDTGPLNVIYEQLFFSRMLLEKRKQPAVLLDYVDENFSEVLRFNAVPSIVKYAHAINYAKRSSHAYCQVEERLRYEFPAVHRHISARYASAQYHIIPAAETAPPPFYYSLRWMKRLDPDIEIPVDEHTCDRIEELVSDNFEEPGYKMLLDIYQIEKAMQELEQENRDDDQYWEKRKRSYDAVYNLDDDFLNNRFTLDTSCCRIAWINHGFKGKDLLTELDEAVEQGKCPPLLPATGSLVVYHVFGKTKCFFLENWSNLLSLFEDASLSGHQFYEHIRSSARYDYKGRNLAEMVQEFLVTHLLDPCCLKIVSPAEEESQPVAAAATVAYQ